jgi:hypothetical protein
MGCRVNFIVKVGKLYWRECTRISTNNMIRANTAFSFSGPTRTINLSLPGTRRTLKLYSSRW